MKARGMALAWIAALALAGSAAGVLVHLGSARTLPDASGEPVALIGSSVTVCAVPEGHIAGGVLGDGRGHQRLVMGAISEAETTTLLARALDAGARKVFVEINALAFDFAYRVDEGHGPPETLHELRQIGRAMRFGLRVIAGIAPDRIAALDERMSRPTQITPEALRLRYPLSLRPPRDRAALVALVERAKLAGVELVLVAPPRAQTAADYIGKAGMSALTHHLRAVADDLALPLFDPGPVWPDRYFIDQAHLNHLGRQRFLTDLAGWRAAAR